MNARPRDYLVTYDPDYLEEHTESSEFEESITSLGQRNSKQYLLIQENLKHVTKKQKDILNHKISNAIFSKHGNTKNHEFNLHRLEDKKAQTSTKLHHRNIDKVVEANGHRNLNKGDQPNYTQKKSLMRHKVIPCLSNMLERSISKLTPKENQLKNISKDNCCQAEIGGDERRQRRKHKRQQKHPRQPVFTLEHVTQETRPFNNHQNIHLDQNKALKKVYSNIICNVTLSEDESEELVQLKRKKCKKQFRTEKREGKLKHSRKSYEQQFPSKKDLYQVYTANQSQYDEKIISHRKESESSGFWDFLVDKFNKKYQSKKPETVKQYYCRDFGIQCCPISLETFGPRKETKRQRKHVDVCPDGDCPCSELMLRYAMDKRRDFGQNMDSSNLNPVSGNKNQTSSKNVQCECSTSTQTHRQTVAVQRPPPPMQEKTCSCQRPHDQLTEHLANKYNGEVLCIHNPPCILINGCLNVAQPQERGVVHAWPVIETKKDSIFKGNRKDKNKKQNRENFTQHHAQSFEVRQCNIPEYRNEKVIQSVCNHTPPCEVIRCCHKERYDPKLQNSCVHVPMCQRVPECVLHNIRESQPIGTCNHKPKCANVPLCTRKFEALTTRDSVGTQVKPQTKMFCRHDPPCVLIPKCLSRPGHETYISYEAVPNCVHQPLCDLIPACCRKPTKGMVNAYSQYPNGCRVV